MPTAFLTMLAPQENPVSPRLCEFSRSSLVSRQQEAFSQTRYIGHSAKATNKPLASPWVYPPHIHLSVPLGDEYAVGPTTALGNVSGAWHVAPIFDKSTWRIDGIVTPCRSRNRNQQNGMQTKRRNMDAQHSYWASSVMVIYV